MFPIFVNYDSLHTTNVTHLVIALRKLDMKLRATKPISSDHMKK